MGGKHRHSIIKWSPDLQNAQCVCGVCLCLKRSPMDTCACLLEKGHPGEHCNPALGERYPEVRWPNKEEVKSAP